MKVGVKTLSKYLGKERFSFDEANSRDEIGIVRGLAWTSVGGDTLSVEVNVLPGSGKFELTGQLGDVMKESGPAGISFIRSMSDAFFIPKVSCKNDIHIHIPKALSRKMVRIRGVTRQQLISAITEIR